MSTFTAAQIAANYAPDAVDGATILSVAGTSYLLHAPTRAVHRLNDSGQLIWQLFDGTATIEDLAADVADVFGASQPAISGDLVAFVRSLGEGGLLKGVTPTNLAQLPDGGDDCQDDALPAEQFDGPEYLPVPAPG